MSTVAARFPRVESRRRARAFVRGPAGRPAAEEPLDHRRARGRCVAGRDAVDQIPLTRNEISRLLIASIGPARHADPLRWSAWRRHHQHRARISHYQRQAATEQ